MVNDEFEDNLGFLISDITRLLRLEYEHRAAKLGVTRAQWRVLAYLYRHDGQTQKELADRLEMEPSPMGRMIDSLEDGGWIERRADPSDRRKWRIYKTKKIDPLIPALARAMRQTYEDAFSGFSQKRKAQFMKDLLAIKKNIVGKAGTAPILDLKDIGQA